MLKSIKVRNFHSIGAEQEMSLQITKKDILDDSSRLYGNTALNVVSCIIGHNASGKTTMLKAFSFLCWFIERSYETMKPDKIIPAEPHKFNSHEPMAIEIEFFEKAILYKYSIEFTTKEVIREYFGKSVKRMTPIFELIRKDDEVTITSSGSLKISESDEARIKSRRNISLLSGLLDLGYLTDISFFKNTEGNVTQVGHLRLNTFSNSFHISQKLHKDENLYKEILSFSDDIDLGITDFNFHEVFVENKSNSEDEEKNYILECIHSSTKGNFKLPIFEESNGTQQSYSLLSIVLPILKTGGVAIIDEIEDGVHPYVIKKIISLFESKETNPHNAQLIFSTHQHLLLNDRTKTQIFITEKSKVSLETELYRLDDVEGIRNDENYFHKYMAGAYGGTPKIHWV